jgi:hypothetical protein
MGALLVLFVASVVPFLPVRKRMDGLWSKSKHWNLTTEK